MYLQIYILMRWCQPHTHPKWFDRIFTFWVVSKWDFLGLHEFHEALGMRKRKLTGTVWNAPGVFPWPSWCTGKTCDQKIHQDAGHRAMASKTPGVVCFFLQWPLAATPARRWSIQRNLRCSIPRKRADPHWPINQYCHSHSLIWNVKRFYQSTRESVKSTCWTLDFWFLQLVDLELGEHCRNVLDPKPGLLGQTRVLG